MLTIWLYDKKCMASWFVLGFKCISYDNGNLVREFKLWMCNTKNWQEVIFYFFCLTKVLYWFTGLWITINKFLKFYIWWYQPSLYYKTNDVYTNTDGPLVDLESNFNLRDKYSVCYLWHAVLSSEMIKLLSHLLQKFKCIIWDDQSSFNVLISKIYCHCSSPDADFLTHVQTQKHKYFSQLNITIDWNSRLYKDPIFKLKNNGWISKVCYMERGIRQGCPISSMTFLFVTEILSIKIMSDQEIKGIKTPMMSINIKSIQRADNATLIFRN